MQTEGKIRSRLEVSLLVPAVVAALALILTACQSQAPAPENAPPPRTAEAPEPPSKIPPFHETLADAGPLPAILPAEQFRAYPVVEHAYRVAARIPEVLALQPCYCYCDVHGHGSLVDCFATEHGGG